MNLTSDLITRHSLPISSTVIADGNNSIEITLIDHRSIIALSMNKEPYSIGTKKIEAFFTTKEIFESLRSIILGQKVKNEGGN